MPFLIALLLLGQDLSSQSQWRLLLSDGSVVSAAGATPQIPAARAAEVKAAWVWSAVRAPRRVAPASLSAPAPAPALPADPGRLELLVRRRSRQPVPADLRVVAAPVEMWWELPESALPSWPVPRNGRLSLPAQPGQRWRLRVVGSGEGSWWVDARAGGATTALASAPAPGFEMAVVDDRGAPIPGVNAYLLEATARGGKSQLWAVVRGEGRLGASGLTDGEELTVSLVKAGYEPEVVRGWPSTLPRQVRLHPGATLVGQVTDGARRPLAGVAVEIEAWAHPDLPQLMQYHATTDTHGEWLLASIPRGRVALTLRKRGFAPLVEQLEVASGRNETGRRVLAAGGALAVAVRDAAGAVVPGAKLEAGPGLSATADAGGEAVLEGVPTAPLEVRASAERHLPASVRVNPPFPPRLVVTLPRAFVITGRFVDSGGSPVSGAVARVESPGCRTDHHLDPTGGFALDLSPAKVVDLILRAPTVRELRVAVAAGEAGELRDLGDLRPPPGLDVTGRVVSAQDGSPVGGAHIWLPRPGPEGPVVAWAGRNLLEATSDGEGRFRLSGLDEGATQLRIDAAGFARAQVAVAGAAGGAAAGDVADLGDVPVSAGTRLHVLVRSSGRSSDAKLEGALARVDLGNLWLDPDMLEAEVREGEAVVPNVPAGTVTVTVLAGQKLACNKQVEVPAAAADLDVDCAKRPMAVAGLVKVGALPAGAGTLIWRATAQAPTAGAEIHNLSSPAGLRQQEVFGLGRPQVDVAVDDGASFETLDVDSGSWQVAWVPEGGSVTGSIAVEIPDQDSYQVELRFAGLAVTGVVTTKDGTPARGARVRELVSGALAFAADDGTFSIAGLKPGPAQLQAQQGELSSRTTKLVLTPDQAPDPVQLVVGDREAPTVAVQVLDAAGAPRPGALVFLEAAGQGQRLLTTGADGKAVAGFEGGEPSAVRAAAYAGGAWALGPWTPWDAALDGLTLAIATNGAGSVVIESRRGGIVKVTSADAWDLSWMLVQMGSPPVLVPGQKLDLRGLPAGNYGLTLGEARAAVDVPPAGVVGVTLE